MVHFQSPLHIVSWLGQNCARKAICRAINEGQVEFFGGFKPIPPTTHPGWIMRVTSAHDRTWYVAVIMYDRRYGIRILRDVPWGNWMGISFWDGDIGFRARLYSGNNPDEYLKLREAWNENRCN